jgi:drug/metabolite transporter (DMT)-like permease
MRLKADLTLLVVAIFWGSAFVAQRVAGQMGSVYLCNGVRYLLDSEVVLPFALRESWSNGSTRQTSNVKLPREQYQWMLVAVLLSQFKERNLRSKIDGTHLVEGR